MERKAELIQRIKKTKIGSLTTSERKVFELDINKFSDLKILGYEEELRKLENAYRIIKEKTIQPIGYLYSTREDSRILIGYCLIHPMFIWNSKNRKKVLQIAKRRAAAYFNKQLVVIPKSVHYPLLEFIKRSMKYFKNCQLPTWCENLLCGSFLLTNDRIIVPSIKEITYKKEDFRNDNWDIWKDGDREISSVEVGC